MIKFVKGVDRDNKEQTIDKKYTSKLDHDHQYRRPCFILVHRKPDSLMVGLPRLVRSVKKIRTPPKGQSCLKVKRVAITYHGIYRRTFIILGKSTYLLVHNSTVSQHSDLAQLLETGNGQTHMHSFKNPLDICRLCYPQFNHTKV